MESFGDRLRPAPADIQLQEMADLAETSIKARYVNEVFINGEKFSVGDKVKVEKIECIDFLPRVIVAEISSIFVVGEEKVSRCTIYTWHPYYKSFNLGKDRILKFEKVEGEVEETRRLVARKGYEEIVRLYKYLHKVIKDSYEAERRPYREPREFLVHIAESGKVTLFIDAGDYARVGRRAIYRLERNLFKNFPFLKGKIDSFNTVEDTCAKGKRIKLEDYIREIFKMHEGYSYKDCISLDQIKLKEG